MVIGDYSWNPPNYSHEFQRFYETAPEGTSDNYLLGNLSKDVFERRTSTGSEVFSLTICLDAKKLVLISFFSLIRAIYLRVSTKPPPNDAKRPLPVDVRRPKTLLLKLPIEYFNHRNYRVFQKFVPIFLFA